MHVRRFLLTLAAAAPFAFAACGGGGMDDAEVMDPAPAADMDQEAASDEMAMEMLGGGHVTPVHEGAGGSPHVSVHWAIDEANITISYGRPYLRDRVVGESVEPMADAVWRLGADEATTLTTDADLTIGDAQVPAGEYTLWTTQTDDAVHLIVNSETGQWGTAYNADHDLAHVAMEVGTLDPPAEQLVIRIGDGVLGFDWGALTASVPLTVN